MAQLQPRSALPGDPFGAEDQSSPQAPNCSAVPIPFRSDASGQPSMHGADHTNAEGAESTGSLRYDDDNHAVIGRGFEIGCGLPAHDSNTVSEIQGTGSQQPSTSSDAMEDVSSVEQHGMPPSAKPSTSSDAAEDFSSAEQHGMPPSVKPSTSSDATEDLSSAEQHGMPPSAKPSTSSDAAEDFSSAEQRGMPPSVKPCTSSDANEDMSSAEQHGMPALAKPSTSSNAAEDVASVEQHGLPPLAESSQSPDDEVERPLSLEVPVTTLMVRNVHGRLRQEQVLQIWKNTRFHYDLFYMPYDAARERTAGYAFINFMTHKGAMEFRARWQGQFFPWMPKGSGAPQAPMDIRPAMRQGFDANIAFWKSTLPETADASVLPAIFFEGRRYAFWNFISCMKYVQTEKASDMTISSEVLSL